MSEEQNEEKDNKLVVNKNVKEYIKSRGYSSSVDFGDALSKKVEGVLESAIARAKANSRMTVMVKDL